MCQEWGWPLAAEEWPEEVNQPAVHPTASQRTSQNVDRGSRAVEPLLTKAKCLPDLGAGSSLAVISPHDPTRPRGLTPAHAGPSRATRVPTALRREVPPRNAAAVQVLTDTTSWRKVLRL